MTRLLIVGEHTNGLPVSLPGFDPQRMADLPAALARVRPNGAPAASFYTAVKRCTSIADLRRAIAETTKDHGALSVLDILDHGAAGGITIGDDIAFQSDGTQLLHGSGLATALAPALTDTAQLRLLGCETGLAKQGRHLLQTLARLLGGHRIVQGTISRVHDVNMDPHRGFLLESELLFSSLAAVDGEAPTYTQRIATLTQWYAALP